MRKHFFLSLLLYLKANNITGFVIGYIFFSALLKLTTTIDVGIPCLWRMLFHFECPGCGLTTALSHVVVLNFEKAYAANRLIFILIPATMSYLYFDFMKFRRKEAL